MSKKRKHGGVKQGFDLFERAQRELAKGNVKDALKDAKVCYREDPSPERRQLLERAYGARAEQLQKAGLNDQAQNALAELTELGVTSPDVQAQLPRLRILLGLTVAGSAGDAASMWEANPELLIELADQAVFHPQRVPDKYVEIHGDCQRIRAALEAVERGDDAAATEQLNDISRRSPFADWKLFVRGLSAFYLGDAERAHANWDRLEPKRPAFRIAQTLLVHSGQLAAESAAFNVANGLRRLEYSLESNPVWEQLKAMGEHFQADQWSGLFHACRSFCQRFANTHAALIERITDLLWKRMVRDHWEEGLNRLMRIAPAPRLDPRWNRARALLAEHSRESTFEDTENYWKAYVRDISRGDFLPKDERGIAAGLVCQRMARAEVEAAHEEEVAPSVSFVLRGRGERCGGVPQRRHPALPAEHQVCTPAAQRVRRIGQAALGDGSGRPGGQGLPIAAQALSRRLCDPRLAGQLLLGGRQAGQGRTIRPGGAAAETSRSRHGHADVESADGDGADVHQETQVRDGASGVGVVAAAHAAGHGGRIGWTCCGRRSNTRRTTRRRPRSTWRRRKPN